jgi:DNA-binding response OmpR family regulator
MPRILIVDDDQAVRGVLRERLEDLYEVVDTGDPAEALELALQMKPDCIMLDLMMPKFSGFELCQTLASLSYTQHIPVFIISGEPKVQYETFCQGIGAVAYFEKPIDFDELRARLATVLSTQIKEHRAEVRVRLGVTLKLKGTDAHGANFEVITQTENVSSTGFRCVCTAPLKVGSIVSVSKVNNPDEFVANARVIWVDSRNAPGPVSGFRFIDKPRQWVLQ